MPRPLPLWPGVAAAVGVACVYLAVASGGRFRFQQSSFPHHVLIADAWLHGQTYVRDEVIAERSERFYRELRVQVEAEYARRGIRMSEEEWQSVAARARPKPQLDWVEFEGHRYGYWGPTTAALLLPWVALRGLDASDVLFSCLVGIGTVLLTYMMLREAARSRLLAMTPAAAAALALLLGVGTVHFYLAVSGQVWFLAQVVATFFLTVAICLVLRSHRGATQTVLASCALAASVLARASIASTLPFFVCAIAVLVEPERRMRHWLALALPLLGALALAFAFNQARFGTPFESGQGLAVLTGGNPALRTEFEQYGRFSLHYAPHNLYYYFVNPWLRRHPSTQALTFDPNGNSLFLVTPALLYVFASLRRLDLFTGGVWLGTLAPLAGLILFYATGWYQFGNRYILDMLPFLILLTARGMCGRLTATSAALIALSIAVNAWGTYRFLQEQF